MTQPATLIVTAAPNPDNAEDLQGYVKQALPMLLNGGGEMIKRARVLEPVVGDITFGVMLVMEFPSAQAIRDVFESDAYAAIVPLRERGFKFMNIVIAEAQS